MNSSADILQKVLAVVVTYFPDPLLEVRVRKLTDQFKEVLVIDNTPNEESKVPLQTLMKFPNISILQMKKNMGIAYALNKGLKYANDHGYQWIGTFDQDSSIPENFLKKLILAWNRFPNKNKVAILSPVYHLSDGTKKCFSSWKHRSIEVREVKLTMTSGNVMDVLKIEQIGGFDEDLFIDYVDYDLCLRLRKRGFLILENKNVMLKHNLGENFSNKNFLFRKVGIPNYPPTRVYYSTRNRFVLYARYWKNYPGFVIHDMLRIPMIIIKIILFETERKDKIKAFFYGFRDGIYHRLGARECDAKK